MNVLQSLDDIFNKRIFRIPDYQRGYAWGKSQLIDFWDDLMSLNDDRFHYTGVISIKEISSDITNTWNDEKWLINDRSYKAYHIIDGQQRLTTSSILIQCLIEAISHANTDQKLEDIYLGSYSIQEILGKYVLMTQPPNYITKAYLFGYETDNPSFNFLRHKIYNEPNAGTIDETFYTLNLENAKAFFTENIKEAINAYGQGILNKIYIKLTQKFMFNLYMLEDDFDEFVAFETMNNRGKKLSDLELLKNRLIYLTSLYSNDELSKEDRFSVRNNINNAWKEVYYQLGRNKNRTLNDDDFLRAHWIIYFKYSRKKGNDYIRFLLDDYFNPKKVTNKVEIKLTSLKETTEIKDHESLDEEDSQNDIEETVYRSKLSIREINDYVESLKTTARHWYNSFNPENNSDYTTEEAIWVDKINRIGIGYFRPLIMSAYASTNSSEKKIELLKSIERFIFIGFRLSRAQSNFKNSAYYNYSRELYKGKMTIDEIINQLNEHIKWTMNDDGNFKTDFFRVYLQRKFKNDGYYGWNGLKYFLFEYEEYLQKERKQPKISWKHFIKGEKDKVSIEHIYPQKDDDPYWVSQFVDIDNYGKHCYKGTLGNLLPLSKSINSSLQNRKFEDKRTVKFDDKGNTVRNGYDNGSYSEQEVAREKDWGPEEIKKRGLTLLSFMEARWNISIGNETEKIDLLHLNFNAQ